MDAHGPASRRTLAVLALAISFAAVCGYIDQHAEEVQLPALLVLASALVCSALQPRAVWLWWLLATLSIPAGAAVARWCGHTQPFESQPFSWLVAAIPAGIGAGLGVGCARLRRRGTPRPPAAA